MMILFKIKTVNSSNKIRGYSYYKNKSYGSADPPPPLTDPTADFTPIQKYNK